MILENKNECILFEKISKNNNIYYSGRIGNVYFTLFENVKDDQRSFKLIIKEGEKK